MFGGRGRGRGGGGRGGGRGRGAGRSGPRLPAKLTKEIFGEGSSAGAGRGRSQPPRKERRKADREARRGSSGLQAGRRLQQQQRPQQQPANAGRAVESRAKGEPPAKRQKTGGSLPGIARGSKFGELLPAQLQAQGGQDPEKELQRQLARKLGLKKGKTQMGGEDGLDEFLEELGGVDDLFDSDSEGGPAAPQRAAGKKRKQPHSAAAPAGSDEDYASDGDEEEGSELDGSEDDELAGLGSDDSDDAQQQEEEEEGSDLGLGGSDADDSLLAGLQSDEDGEEESGGSEEEGMAADEGSDGSDEGDSESGGSEGEEEGEEDAEGSGDEADQHQRQQQAAQQRDQQQQQSTAAGKYVPPALRRAAAAAAAGGGGAASEAAARVERRVRGLLNRLAEANLQGIVSDLAALYGQEGRRLVSDAVCAELIAAAAEGPRASDRFAAVTASAVAGLAGTVRADEIVANFLDRLASRLESAAAAGDSLSCHNLGMAAAHLYLAGALKPDLVYSMLHSWRQRFTEQDVSMIATLLHAAGLQLRAADPVAMKEFVVAVHARAAQAGGAATLSKRAQVLLELVVDVKNNRRRDEAKHKQVVLAPAVGKWLKACGAADVAVGGITWAKVLQAGKKGIWWMPEAADAQPQHLAGSAAALRAAAAEVAAGGGEGGLAGPELLKLAASLRMNTDVRRAVFCIVMGSEDCVDAVERLLRLGLKGEQEREVVRVTVECCLQEKAWNAYYSHLLLRLCGAGKGHKMTLQFCFWDHLKELAGMEVRRLTNLARLMAAVLAASALPPSLLKVVDFSDALSAREVLFWRVFFEHLLASCKAPADVAAIFKRIAVQPDLKPLRVALLAFLRRNVGPWLAARQPGSGGLSAEQLGELLRRLRGAEKALASSTA